MGWFSDDSSWDPGNWGSVRDVPLLGDAWKGVFGDPDSAKQAYDQQIAASKQQAAEMKDFLLGQKGQAQALYAPLQHMFQKSYGTEGLQAPQVPQATAGVGPLSQMYGRR